MNARPQEGHADLGLRDGDDHTEDMRKAPVAPEAFRSESTPHAMKGSS